MRDMRKGTVAERYSLNPLPRVQVGSHLAGYDFLIVDEAGGKHYILDISDYIDLGMRPFELGKGFLDIATKGTPLWFEAIQIDDVSVITKVVWDIGCKP